MLYLNPIAAACLCAALSAGVLHAQTTSPSTSPPDKGILQDVAFPGNGYHTVLSRGELAPGVAVAIHTHPGIESGYILEGGGVLHIQGLPDQLMRPGDSTVVPPNTPHWFTNGSAKTVTVSTYVLESGKQAREKLPPSVTAASIAAAPANPPVPVYPTAPPPAASGQTVLQSVAFPGSYYTRITRTAIPANARAPRHEHPGIEVTYVLAGDATLMVAGQPDRRVHAGESFVVPEHTPHLVLNGAGPTELLSSFILEDGKPAMQIEK